MNVITPPRPGSSTNTTISLSLGFDNVSNVATATVKPPICNFTFQISEHRKSPLTGRLPRSVASALKESQDPHYRRQKAAARRYIAGTFLNDEGPDSLARLRLSRGFSQHELAKMTGTSQSHIAKIEAGSVKIYWDTGIRLADALGVTLDELRHLIEREHIKPEVVAL
ncbi:helix-turn-helix domain-containing protein [Pandoraea sp. NE5]|uniref:helix-turn-helix domain-containing protein n=1 Tax=Pandoraea sp. NE5 TaxID=2904129 RepID=UPI003965B1FE